MNRCLSFPQASEVRGELLGVLVTLMWCLGQAAGQDHVESAGETHVQSGGRQGFLIDDLVENGGDVVPGKRFLAGQQLVEDHGQGEEVRTTVDLAAGDLLRRHVVGRPEELPGAGEA